MDEVKAKLYYEQAAMRGEAVARYNLGIEEENMGNMNRALKHHMIAAECGYSYSLKEILKFQK